MKILIVDDTKIMRTALVHLVRGWGHSVVTAETGNQAIEILNAQGNFGAVISDFNMPQGDGWDVLMAVKGKLTIPVAILSADFVSDSGVRLKKDLETQGARCFPKPLGPSDTQELRAIIATTSQPTKK